MGKTAKWVNNVLTLVDKPQNVMERIKTFEDAINELTNRAEHGDVYAKALLYEYDTMNSPCIKECSKDLLAYLKLRIVTSALNEGWKPKFTNAEIRWYPWFRLDISSIKHVGSFAYAYDSPVYEGVGSASSCSSANYASKLALKSKELAEYAGKQFIDIYADYLF